MSHRLTPAALTAAIVLLAPAGAQAALVSVAEECYTSGQKVTVRGTQFTPNGAAGISIGEEVPATVPVNASGIFETTIVVPRFTGGSLGPRTFTVSAIDSNPQNTASPISVWAVKRTLATNAPIAGQPSTLTTWRFAGFTPGRDIYGHFRFRGVTHRNYRFGRARALGGGPCGALDVRAPRLPLRKLRAGVWRLQIDHRGRYNRRTTPRTIVRFQIFRRVGA